MDEEKLIEQLIKEKGGTRKQYLSLLNSVAYHESAHTMDPTIKQMGGGPGRGMFQFEEGKNRGGITAARRTKRYLDKIDQPTPEWLQQAISGDSLDATKLDASQQKMLFLGNMRMHPTADFSNYVSGKESKEDFWANYHWAGADEDRPDRLKSFGNSMASFNGEQPNTGKKSNPGFQGYRNAEVAQDNTAVDTIDYSRMKLAQPNQQSANIPQEIQEKIAAQQQKQQEPEQDLMSYMKENAFNAFNGGGTHEQNPNGGIPQGMGANGKQNTVEEGETSFDFGDDKFIFSDRVSLTDYVNSSKKSKPNQFADGGKLNGGCGGPGQPPCKEDVSRPLEVGNTANTVRNMWGNLGQYMLGKADKNLEESPYRPTTGANLGLTEKYFTRSGMREDIYKDLTSEKVMKDYNHSGEFTDIHSGLASKGEDREHNADTSFPLNQAGYNGMYNEGHGNVKGQINLGRYRTDAGEDDKGKYISFNDTYDWNGFKTENAIPFYDRIYEEEWNNFSKAKKDKIREKETKARKKLKRMSTGVTSTKF